MNARQAKALAMHHSAAIISKERAKVDSEIELAAQDGKLRQFFLHLSEVTIEALREDGYHVEYKSESGGQLGCYVVSW